MSKESKVKELLIHKTVMMPIDQCKLDPTNPNVMTEAQMDALEKIMIKYGFGNPVKLDSKNIFIDGEHRWTLAKERFGLKKIPAIVFPNVKTPADRKILRQIFNRFHGEDDPAKLREDLQFLQKTGNTELLATLMAQPIENFIVPENGSEMGVSKDDNIMASREQSYLEGNIKQIYLFFSNEQYEDIMPRLKKLLTDLDIENNTDLFIKLVEHFEKCTCK